jgi:hypothetical protein
VATQQQAPQQQQWQPTLTKEQTRISVNNYRDNPNPQYLESLRSHAQYHNIPFYEGDFSILDAIKQAGGGLFEGFTTFRIADPPDNEYEAIIRNISHLAGFVPGLMAGPLKALGLKSMARAIGGFKSVPMWGADKVTKYAKKYVVKPALKGSLNGRFGAVNTASKFMLGDKAKHVAEGAFHLGVASAISSWPGGVDEMMHSFAGGAVAGAGFRTIGNIIPGTKAGDKALRALSGSLFMGLGSTARGATTPEQIYEYLLGAYFGGKEQPFFRTRAVKYLEKGEKLARSGDDPEFTVSRNPEKIEGFKKEPQIVKDEVNKIFTTGNKHMGGDFKGFGTESERKGMAYLEMKLFGILDQIPEAQETPELGYKALHKVKYGKRIKTRKQAHPEINIATSGGAEGSDAFWGKVMEKYGVHVVHNLIQSNRQMIKSYQKRGVKGIERHLKDPELLSLGPMVDRANETLNRPISEENYRYFLSNAHQVKNAQSVFAVGEIETSNKRPHLNGRTVKGSTGWGVQMGIDKGLKHIYVFDPTHKVAEGKKGAWFQWNPGIGMFSHILKTPKLTRNPALIGTRGDIKWKDSRGNIQQKLSERAKSAMEDVAEATFGDKVPGKSKTEIKEYHRKTARVLNKINRNIIKAEESIKEIQESIKQKPDKRRLRELKAELKTEKAKLRAFETRRKRHLSLKPSQFKNESGKTVNDSDVGMTAADHPLMQRGEHFATKYLKKLWEGSDNVRNNILNYGITVDRVLKDYIEIGNKNIKDKEAIADIIKTLSRGRKKDITISQDGKNQIKRWLRDLNLGKQVTYIQTFDGKKVRFTKASRPVSLSGKLLNQLESEKLIQYVYDAEGGKLKKDEESSLVIFDSISARNPNGVLNDVPLNRLEDFFEYQVKSKNPKQDANKIKKRVIGQMAKRDMYPLGGQGDNGRVIFVKFHPKTQKQSKTKVDKDVRLLRKELKKLDKKSTNLLKEDIKKAKKEYGITAEQFEKMLHSNMMYDLSLNGFKTDKETIIGKDGKKQIVDNFKINLEKVIGDGFIPSAIQYNKRAQIWMTNGYGGNKEFIKNEINDLSKDGNYNYILVKDPKKTKLSSLLAKNVELPEHVDGAILVRQDVIDAINRDAAHPESGQNKSFIIDPSFKHGALLGKYMLHTVGEEGTAAMKAKGLHMMIMTSAAKQTGTRIPGNYEVKKPKQKIIKSSRAIEREWEDYVDSPNPTDPRVGTSKMIIRRGDEFVKVNKFTGKKKDWFNPVRSKIEWAAFNKQVYDEATDTFKPLTETTGGLDIGKSVIYELDPGSLKYNDSVINDKHMAQKQIWVKQLFTNLHEFGYKKIDQSVIKDIHETIIQKAYDGDTSSGGTNEKLADYIRTLDSRKIEHLIENLESIGTSELTSALKTPGAELFAEKALQRMLRLVEDNIEADYRSGESSKEERNQSLRDLQDAIGPIDKLLRNVAIVGEEMSLEGKTGFSGYLHKYIAPYKAAVLHNYFVKSITRPKVDNSAVARIRPYDKWMEKDFKDLNTRDDIFYLDKAYEETRIKKEDGSFITLGDLWAAYNNKRVTLSPTDKAFAENVFEAVVLRVPMDSMSGAQKLKFKGFTGRKGHGIMMHSRNMRAIGGADLDGDEAFIYFGGRREDGTGFGMKKSWKDAIHAQKNEFIDPKTKDYKDNKDAFRDELTLGSDPLHPLKKSKALYYSPYSRLKASEGAIHGRNMLGTTVSQGQVMKSMYSSLMAASGQRENYTIEIYNKKTKKKEKFTVVRTPKQSVTDRTRQRDMTRAQIAFASDPLDEIGLKHKDVFFQKLHDAYFNVKVLNSKGKQVKMTLNPSQLKKGLFDIYRDMNGAYFGRNYEQNRRYTMDEVNYKASKIANLDIAQRNTILPKMVDTLQGTDWSDNLYHRIAGETGKDKSNNLKSLYNSMNEIVKEFDWIKKAMGRVTFEVPYNDHVKTVIRNKLYNRAARERIAKNITMYKDALQGTTFGKQLTSQFNKDKQLKYWQFPERLRTLEEIAMLGEHYLANDLADMATILNIKRILDASKGTKDLNEKKIGKIMHKVDELKARSYLNMSERKELDYRAYTGDDALRKGMEWGDMWRPDLGLKVRKSDLIGDKRSAIWDQAMIDEKIKVYKSNLNETEKELFDHLMIGTYRRGELKKLQDLVDKVSADDYNPIFNTIVKEAIDEVSSTKLSRLGYNSQEVNDKAVRDHLRAMSDAFGKTWKEPTKKEIDDNIKDMEKVAEENNIGEKAEVDSQVENALANEAYAGIEEGTITRADKDLMVRLATNLKKHNNKMGDNLNEVLGGIMDAMGEAPKDLNAMNRRDFEAVNNYLEEVESGTVWQKIFGKKTGPELQKRYYWLFPASTNRELMAYDIKWLKKEGFFITKTGDSRPGTIQKPTYFLDIMQKWIHKANELSTGKATEIAKEIEEKFMHLKEINEGDFLFEVAVYERELANRDRISSSKDAASLKEAQKLNYEISLQDTEKEFDLKWKDIREKKFTITNDNGERVRATGRDIVRGKESLGLEGIKKKQTNLFKQWHNIIAGDKETFAKYKGRGFYDKAKKQPIMNWQTFVNDIGKALERGDDIPMNIGIDGMRHISRSMLVDLYGPAFKDIEILKTGDLSEMYWPHMFFNKKAANISMKETIKRIKKDPSMSEEDKGHAMRRALIRHKTLSGEWEFQDMQDFDRIDTMNIKQGLEDIATIQKERQQKIHWTDADIKFGSMKSRTGHEGGWSKDISVMNAYSRNLASTYYRQISQIMTNKVINDAWTQMSSKFGPELAGKWQKFFKLYAQGAMGNPDVIPEDVYNDPTMKIKGTPYAWFADNKVLDRVNKIREGLGINKKDLPKELQEFTYKDIRDWSNLEAKFELASLLAHPKSSITNIFGGTLHTIQSAGLPNFKDAKDIRFLKRINPEWRSMEDVTDWVIKKGVLQEYLVHELGLGKNVDRTNVQNFVKDLSSQINSKDPVKRKELFSLGKKHGLSSKIIDVAAKFMSVPERMLRRDAFMAHYIQAWKRFGGTIKDPNHPFLIEQGKKGVKATQFLYEATHRPLFARTALGKVMSRFQLFAWNSFRFRNDIIRQAKRYGFIEGTEAFERYRRTMTIDLFVVALGNMFAYSLFDNSLPSPWNWFQDTSEWLFGDEKEREKAFFGTYPGAAAPLQLITPTIARFPVAALRQWIDDDYGRFTDYYAWQIAPFGRFARDIFHKDHGLVNNPMRIMEKFTGMPVMDLSRQIKKKKKAIEKGERYKLPGIGVKTGY